MRNAIRNALARVGLSLHRWPPSRFEAMHETLQLLRRRGYDPRMIIDVGANMGQWSRLAASVFTPREHHVFEPQAACHAALARLPGRAVYAIHPLALTARPGQVFMVGEGTGAWVTEEHEKYVARPYQASTLDLALAERVTRADRPLLKLDVENHELEVLSGGEAVLSRCEVVVVEFHLFSHTDTPTLTDIIVFLRERGFELYDFAGLASRPRDLRLKMGDAVFVHRDSPLLADSAWE